MRLYKYILIFCFSLYSLAIVAQNDIELQVDFIEIIGDVNTQDKADIIRISENLLNRYYETANFWDLENDQFSDDKFGEFLTLFLGSSRVFDDLSNTGTSMGYTDYADLAYENFQDRRIRYSMDEVYINSIEYDSLVGSYIATLEFVKIMFISVDADGNIETNSEGNDIELTMEVDLPGFDLEEAKIANIIGKESIKNKKLKESITYYSLSANYGIGFPTTSPINESFNNAFNNFSLSGSSLGANFNIRKSLGRGNLNLLVGVGAKLISFKSDIAGYNNNNLDPSFRLADNVESHSVFEFDDLDQGHDASLGNTTVTVDNIANGVENISILALELPIGIGLRIMDNFKSDFFLDVTVVPIYNLSYSGDVKGDIEGIQIPNSPHFPTEQLLAAGDAVLDNYRVNESIDQALKSDGSTFSVGLAISPTYTYELDDTYGLELGLSFWYNILPLFKEPAEPTDGYLKSILSNNNDKSLLETYFKDVKTGLASFKIGFFYKIDSTL